MASPSSFCTMCTHTCYFEFIGLAYSLSLHHPCAKFYCMLDTKTKEELDNLTLKPNLNIIVKVLFVNYSKQICQFGYFFYQNCSDLLLENIVQVIK